MKEIRISLLLLVSLILLLVSFVVLFIWGFAYYRQTAQPATIVVKDSSGIAVGIRDSLQQMVASTVHKLSTELDSTRQDVDSVQVAVDEKLQTFYALKDEITRLIEAKNTSPGISDAKQQLILLQEKVADWRRKYDDVADENKRLAALLKQLTANVNATASPVAVPPGRGNTKPLAAATSEPSSLFVASNLQLKAVMLLDDKEQETYDALQADEMRGELELRNNFTSVRGADVFVVILQPDGTVLRQSAWETGMFETGTGRKIYSRKLHFDYTKAELKRLNFSIATSGLKKGRYTMQVYNNGVLIGSFSKSLS